MPRRAKPGMPVPGVGDRALVRTERERDPEPGAPEYAGRVIKLLSKQKSRVLGIFRVNAKGGGGRIEPIDKKQFGRELAVNEADRENARDGDLVAVDILRTRLAGLPTARVREIIGAIGSEKAVSQIAIATHGIPDVFRPETLAEADKAQEVKMEAEGFRREDWRSVPLVTIDPPDAKDHDDAVFAEVDTTRTTKAASSSPSPSPMSLTMCARIPRSTARRSHEGTRSISPTASYRCCPSASPTTSARCAPTKTVPLSPCACASTRPAARSITLSIA